MVLLYLLEKEFKQFFRDPGLPKMAIAFPVLMMLVFPFAVSMEIRNVDLVVVDSNRSVASSKLVESCTASGYFNLVEVCDDPARAMQLMDRNKADAILTIESDFDRCLERLELPVAVDTTFKLKDGDEADETDDIKCAPLGTNCYNVAWDLYELIETSLPILRAHDEGDCNPDMMSHLYEGLN